MKNRNVMIGVLGAGLIFLLSVANSHAMEKPVVAIKEAKVAETVAQSARKYLNLEKLLAEMEASFLATRKFDVVTRNKDSLTAIRDEQKFAESDLAAGDAAESGQLQNANYLIIPEVHRFAFYRETHKVPNLQHKYFKREHGLLEVNAQIVDTKTGQIKTTFYLKDTFSTPEEMVNESSGVPSRKYFTDLAKGVSGQMANQFIAVVFPMEIISLKGDTVFINRGQDGGFKLGDTFNVYTKGDDLVDPHTGESLGAEEEFVGVIKVSRINPKYTIATIVQDKLEGEMSVGCIVRKP